MLKCEHVRPTHSDLNIWFEINGCGHNVAIPDLEAPTGPHEERDGSGHFNGMLRPLVSYLRVKDLRYRSIATPNLDNAPTPAASRAQMTELYDKARRSGGTLQEGCLPLLRVVLSHVADN